jgi:hypothetical protein
LIEVNQPQERKKEKPMKVEIKSHNKIFSFRMKLFSLTLSLTLSHPQPKHSRKSEKRKKTFFVPSPTLNFRGGKAKAKELTSLLRPLSLTHSLSHSVSLTISMKKLVHKKAFVSRPLGLSDHRRLLLLKNPFFIRSFHL